MGTSSGGINCSNGFTPVAAISSRTLYVVIEQYYYINSMSNYLTNIYLFHSTKNSKKIQADQFFYVRFRPSMMVHHLRE